MKAVVFHGVGDHEQFDRREQAWLKVELEPAA
jgi:hypothetical protein